MALLSIEERARYFRELGLGEYNQANIRALQKKYFKSKDVDGKYGTDTDNLLRHIYNVETCTKNFKPEEFKCECGGKYCTGYPTYMKRMQLLNLQSIRNHYGKPMKVTSGMRCKKYNSVIGGSISNSKHLTGQATDFYIQGITDTLAHRKSAIKWMKKLPNTTYIYGNGINSNGASVRAPYMGNALHYDTKNATTVTKPNATKLTVDGVGGPATVRAAQTYFKCSTVDGYISGQKKSLQQYYPALTAVLYGNGGSECVKAIQKWAGFSNCDGIWGHTTSKAVQKKLGLKETGVFDKVSMKVFQTFLNNQLFPEKVDLKPVTKTEPEKSQGGNSEKTVQTAPVIKKFEKPTVEEIAKASRNGMIDRGEAWLRKIAADNTIHYVKYNSDDSKTKNCWICKGYKDAAHKGWNCIGETASYWHHGLGLANICNCHFIDNDFATKLLKMSVAEATKQLRKKIGLKDIKVTISKKNIKPSSIPAGAICICYTKGKYYHTCPSIGGGKTIDCGNYKKKADQIKERTLKNVRVYIEYTGGNLYLQEGDWGTAVAKVQRYLGIADDGKFGPKTKAAVEAYQKKVGLTPDGKAGPATLAKMAEGK